MLPWFECSLFIPTSSQIRPRFTTIFFLSRLAASEYRYGCGVVQNRSKIAANRLCQEQDNIDLDTELSGTRLGISFFIN